MGEKGQHRYYVYAIAAPHMRLPEGISGFGGPLHVQPYGELGAVVSCIYAAEADSIATAANTENLVRHEAVVEAVRRCGPALPVRFGTVLPDDAALSRALAAHYQALRDDLRRVGDKVELGVSVLWRPAEARTGAPPSPLDEGARNSQKGAAVAARSGREYLLARQAVYRQAESARERAQTLARELDDLLRPHVLACRRSLCPSERLALRDVFLLERERVGAVESVCADVRQRHPEALVLVSGPWPPYSFVTPPAHKDTEAPHGRSQRERAQQI